MDDLNTKGIYSLTYGYSNHKLLFVSTKEEISKCINGSICIEVAKHYQVDIYLEDIILETEDADFVEKFEKYNLSTLNPLDYYNFGDEE